MTMVVADAAAAMRIKKTHVCQYTLECFDMGSP
jgi:hypothetical protein